MRRRLVGLSGGMETVAGPDGNRIAFDRFGRDGAVPILLLHGAGQTRHSWRKVASPLAEARHHGVMADLRGHGDSDRAPDGVYRYERLVGDVSALIDAAGGRVVLVGASLGGKIGLAAAAALGPERVSGLVLIDAVPRSSETGIARVAGVLRAADGFLSPQDAAEFIARGRGEIAGPEAGAKLARNLRPREGRWYWHYDPRFFDPVHELGVVPALGYLEGAAAKIGVPALLVRGGRSDVVDAAGAAALARLIPSMETVVIPDAGHLVANDRPAALAAALLSFLERVAQSAP